MFAVPFPNVLSELRAQQQMIGDFKSWRTEEGQDVQFESDKISVEFSARIDYSLKGFDFISDRQGYAVGIGDVGQYPVFYSPENGGQSWTRNQLRIGWNPTGIAFRNSQVGLITTHDVTGCPPPNCLNKTITLNTKDGGQNWELINHKELRGLITNPATDSSVNFYAAVVLYSYETGTPNYTISLKLVKSVDAGFKLEVIYEAGSVNHLAQSFQLVGDTIYVLSDESAIVKLDTSGSVVGKIEARDGIIVDFIAVSDDVLFALTYANDSTGNLVRTVDGGQSWDIIRRDNPLLIATRSPDEVVVSVRKGRMPGPLDTSGSVSAVVYTKNDGQEWVESELFASFYSRTRWHSETSKRDLVLLNDRIVTVLTSPGEH